MADVTFAPSVAKVWRQTLSPVTGVWKAMLLVSDGAAWTPNGATEQFVSSAVGDECSVAGYSRQTLTFTGVGGIANCIVDHGDGVLTFRADNPTFAGLAAGETANRIVIYREVTNDADSQMFCCLDLPAPGFATSLGSITVNENAGANPGWFKF